MGEVEWTIPKSIFGPRAIGTRDKAGYYDTEDKLIKCIELDWSLAQGTHKTSTWLETQGGPDESDACLAVLRQYAPFVLGCFDFYNTLSKTDDICHMWKPGFQRFIGDINFEDKNSKTCAPNDVTKIWKMLGAPPTDDPNYLNRYEWLQCLVRLAVMKHGPAEPQKQAVPNLVAEALRTFLTENVLPRVDRRALADPNMFRETFCYVEDVDGVLREWEPSLRNIFRVYAYGDGIIDDLWSTDMMGYDEWKDLVLDLLLYDIVDFTAREASLTFSWSRLRELDERPKQAKVRMMQLSFEEFLEALIHVASFKVIPLDSDADEAGCDDAGELMFKRLQLPKEEREALSRAAVKDFDEPLEQPMFHLLEGLFSYITRVVTGNASTKVSFRDAQRFKDSMDEGSGEQSKRAKMRRSMLDVFLPPPAEPVDATRELNDEQKVMASLFGMVNGTQPDIEAS